MSDLSMLPGGYNAIITEFGDIALIISKCCTPDDNGTPVTPELCADRLVEILRSASDRPESDELANGLSIMSEQAQVMAEFWSVVTEQALDKLGDAGAK